MKKLFFLTSITIATLSLLLLKNPIAQEGSSSATLDKKIETEEIQVKEDDSRIQEIKETVRQKVEEKLEQVISEQKKVGWLGIIKKIDTSTITLENNEGKERQVLFSDETVVVTQKSQKLEIEDLTEGKRIVALGFQEAENIANAKRIILTEKEENNKLPLLGTISDKSQVEDLIVVTPLKNKDQTLEITITSKAEIIDLESKKINYDDLQKGQKVALVYEEDEEKNTALLIKILFTPEAEKEETEETENLTDN